MIAVAGEALIDLVVYHDGRIGAQPGGGPFNAARTLGRLGLAPVFLGRLSRDRFGGLLRARLDADGVTLAVPGTADTPTTLAVVDVDHVGSPRYRFYLAGTSAADLAYEPLLAAIPVGVAALHIGSLALVMEPIATSIERLAADGLPPRTLVMLDPNCRADAITDEQAYRARLSRLLRRTDVVKVSVEDLAFLCPGLPPRPAAAALLRQGPSLVLVTDGPRPARALLPGQELTAEVPSVEVADTIGAGDAFGGGFLGWWSASGLGKAELSDPGLVHTALRAAGEIAALTCTRVGAEPPRLSEVRGRTAWPGDGGSTGGR